MLDVVSSTNDMVKRALEEGEAEGFAVCARSQTGGYGRLGRTWSSPEGGLYLSVLLRPNLPPAQLPTLSLVVALAVRRAATALLPAKTRDTICLKWPNDLVVPAACQPPERVPFRKVCGISLEAHAGGVCVGVGVNVRRSDGGDVRGVDGKNVPAYLEDLGYEGSIEALCQGVLRELEKLYGLWLYKGFAFLLPEYERHATLVGQEVCMVDGAGAVVASGRVEGVDERARLLLRAADGSLTAVSSGEAHLIQGELPSD